LRILDVGCAAGENAMAVAASLGPSVVTIGLDWGHPPLVEARRRGMTAVQGAADGVHLPFADGSFDVVMLCEVIEHLVDTDRVVEEARRLLRPGGAFLVTTPNLGAWFNRLLLAAGRQPVFSEVSGKRIYGRPGTWVVGHLRLFTRRALVAFLADNGFTDLEVAGAPFHDVPRVARPLDRLLSRWPEVAAGLLVAARAPGGSARDDRA
jgi:SAM-dependent methyltransferase